MNAEEFSRMILNIDGSIRFSGIDRKMFTQQLGNLDFVVYLYEKVRMISMPLKDQVLVLSADNYGNLDELLSKLKKRMKEIAPDLELRKAFTPLDKEKLEILRNLFESGISEEMIAEQLDLDIDTVKLAIREMSKTT